MLMLLLQLWFGTPSADPHVLLAGSWQSCRGDDGEYGERVWDHCVLGKCDFSVHLGPRDEFALYKGRGPEGEDHSHAGPDNLLGPRYHVNDVDTWRGKRNWNVPALRLWVSVVAAGGSRDICDSFFVLVRRQ